jgi:hypothetical protein
VRGRDVHNQVQDLGTASGSHGRVKVPFVGVDKEGQGGAGNSEGLMLSLPGGPNLHTRDL